MRRIGVTSARSQASIVLLSLDYVSPIHIYLSLSFSLISEVNVIFVDEYKQCDVELALTLSLLRVDAE
jgi:hypothetical protein